jgi:hypothetical protein
MKNQNEEIEKYRDLRYSSKKYGNNGLFFIDPPFLGQSLKVIVSDGGDWDHVSVSTNHRCPNWREMCFIKDLFFESNETCVQFHPSKDQYINNHPFCLHIWRPQKFTIDLPPYWMVGVKGTE